MGNVFEQLQQVNPELEIKLVTDSAYERYGKVYTEYDPTEIIERAMAILPTIERVAYEPSVAALEEPCAFNRAMAREVYGGMPVQVGWCYGINSKMNAMEWHKGSEIDVCLTDCVLLIGHVQDVAFGDERTYDSNLVEVFFAPAGSVVELAPWNLHFAPINVVTGKQFGTLVYLPKGTNERLTFTIPQEGDNRLLAAVNKWLIAHPDMGGGAYKGITGPNIVVNPIQ